MFIFKDDLVCSAAFSSLICQLMSCLLSFVEHLAYPYTNEYFAHLLGVGLTSVKSSLNRLYQKHILDHRTYTVYGNGRANRQRVLTVKPPIVWDLAA